MLEEENANVARLQDSQRKRSRSGSVESRRGAARRGGGGGGDDGGPPRPAGGAFAKPRSRRTLLENGLVRIGVLASADAGGAEPNATPWFDSRDVRVSGMKLRPPFSPLSGSTRSTATSRALSRVARGLLALSLGYTRTYSRRRRKRASSLSLCSRAPLSLSRALVSYFLRVGLDEHNHGLGLNGLDHVVPEHVGRLGRERRDEAGGGAGGGGARPRFATRQDTLDADDTPQGLRRLCGDCVDHTCQVVRLLLGNVLNLVVRFVRACFHELYKARRARERSRRAREQRGERGARFRRRAPPTAPTPPSPPFRCYAT